MKRITLIDIGTNSVKAPVYEHTSRGWRIAHFAHEPTRLGGHTVPGKGLNPSAVTRTGKAVASLVSWADNFDADAVFAFATFAIRNAANGEEALARLSQMGGIPIKGLSGKEEAEFAFRAAASVYEAGRRRLLCADIGGGSTELIAGQAARAEVSRSYPIGAVSLRERFGSDIVDVTALRGHVVRQLRVARRDFSMTQRHASLVASGGAITTAARLLRRGPHTAERRIELRRDDLSDLMNRLAKMRLTERYEVNGLPRDRADVIVPGLAIVLELLGLAGRDRLTLNPGGIRDGVLRHLIDNGFRW